MRQLWLELNHQLLIELPQSVYEEHFAEGLLRLSLDSVSNVRISLSLLLVGWKSASAEGATVTVPGPESPWYWLMKRPDIEQCVRHLSNDNYDVYTSIIILEPLFPGIKFGLLSGHNEKRFPPHASLQAARLRESNKLLLKDSAVSNSMSQSSASQSVGVELVTNTDTNSNSNSNSNLGQELWDEDGGDSVDNDRDEGWGGEGEGQRREPKF